MHFSAITPMLRRGEGRLPLTGLYANGTRVVIEQASGPVGGGPARFRVTMIAPSGEAFSRIVAGIAGALAWLTECRLPAERADWVLSQVREATR